MAFEPDDGLQAAIPLWFYQVARMSPGPFSDKQYSYAPSVNYTSGNNFHNVFAMDWVPLSTNTALTCALYGNVDYAAGNTIDVTGAGHGIGVLGRFRNQSTRAVALAVGTEGVVESNGGGSIAQGWGVVAHISVNGVSSSIATAAGFSDLLDIDANGAITAYAGLLLNDMTNVSNIGRVTYRYGVLQNDPNAWNIFAGRMWGGAQARKAGVPVMPELSPPPHPGFAVNRYYTAPNGTTIGPVALAANTAYCCPFFVSEETTFHEIGIRVTTLIGGSNVRLGVYRAWAGVPKELLFDAGAVSTATTGAKTIAISQKLEPGLYFLVALSSANPAINWILDGTTSTNGMTTDNGGEMTISTAMTYGALPASFGTPTYVNGGGYVPLIWMRRTS